MGDGRWAMNEYKFSRFLSISRAVGLSTVGHGLSVTAQAGVKMTGTEADGEWRW